jgi:preprotein translocase subunit SecG
MFDLVFIIHIALCVVLIGLVLVQQGKGADAGAIMGGGTDSVFAAGSAGSVVSKLTTGLAIAFMITSITLVKLYQERSFVRQNDTNVLEGSVLEDALTKKEVVTEEATKEIEAVKEEVTEEVEAIKEEVAEKVTEAKEAVKAEVSDESTKVDEVKKDAVKKVEEASKK